MVAVYAGYGVYACLMLPDVSQSCCGGSCAAPDPASGKRRRPTVDGQNVLPSQDRMSGATQHSHNDTATMPHWL